MENQNRLVHKRLSRLLKSLLILLYLFSVIMIGQAVICLVFPSNYPTSNLKNIENARSIENPPLAISKQASLSSVQFLNYPINFKQSYEVNLKDLNDVSFDLTIELRVTGNLSEPIYLAEGKMGPYDQVNNFQVLIDGQNTNYDVIQSEGKNYYVINGLNLTRENELRTLEIRFDTSRVANSSRVVKIPWIFNENYAQYVNFQVIPLPLQVHNISDTNTFKITLGLPYQEILVQQSGWMDMFVQPKSEWILTNSGFEYQAFEYPIDQKSENYGTTYSFKTNFSESNISNGVQIILVPTWRIPALMLVLLSSPFIITALHLVEKRFESKQGSKKKETAINALKTLRKLWPFYIYPLASIFIGFIIGGFNISQLGYMIQVTTGNIFGVIFVFVYPIGFSLIFFKLKK